MFTGSSGHKRLSDNVWNVCNSEGLFSSKVSHVSLLLEEQVSSLCKGAKMLSLRIFYSKFALSSLS